MGTNIRTIVEIRKDGKWQYVPEVLSEFNSRNYKTFSVLADGVRSSFGSIGFAPKGLPKDISAKKFNFESNRKHCRNVYETMKCVFFVSSEGEKMHPFEVREKLGIDCYVKITNEKYNLIKETMSEQNSMVAYSRYCTPSSSTVDGKTSFFVFDAGCTAGGCVQELVYADVYPDFEEFLKAEYSDEWDEDAQDYGEWKVDFTDEDMYSHSYISLEEFLQWDSTDYTKVKYKMDREFYEKFKAAGGVFPDIFEINDGDQPIGSIVEAYQQAFSPTVLVAWQTEPELWKETPMFKGIAELKTIAEKYKIANPADIRIVFAFG